MQLANMGNYTMCLTHCVIWQYSRKDTTHAGAKRALQEFRFYFRTVWTTYWGTAIATKSTLRSLTMLLDLMLYHFIGAKYGCIRKYH